MPGVPPEQPPGPSPDDLPDIEASIGNVKAYLGLLANGVRVEVVEPLQEASQGEVETTDKAESAITALNQLKRIIEAAAEEKLRRAALLEETAARAEIVAGQISQTVQGSSINELRQTPGELTRLSSRIGSLAVEVSAQPAVAAINEQVELLAGMLEEFTRQGDDTIAEIDDLWARARSTENRLRGGAAQL